MRERRRLPVLQEPSSTSSEEDHDDERPSWHWVGFGIVAIFAAWLPLSVIVSTLVKRKLVASLGALASEGATREVLEKLSSRERTTLALAMASAHVVALALACVGGGVLVGRFGRANGKREASAAGASTALLAVALGATSFELNLTTILVVLTTVLVSTAAAYVGGSIGVKLRRA